METSHVMTESVLDVQESLFQCRVGPLCLGIVINHLTECDVIDIIPAPNLHIKLAVRMPNSSAFTRPPISSSLRTRWNWKGEGEEGLIIIYSSMTVG